MSANHVQVVDEVHAIAHAAPIEHELTAMRAVVDSFERLDVRARRRVLEWAEARYGTNRIELEHFMPLLTSFMEALGSHQKSTKQPRQVDRDLWDATIKDTKYWSEPAGSQSSTTGTREGT